MNDGPKKIAFAVTHNGRHVCRAGLNGEAGVMTAIVEYVQRAGQESLAFHVGGLRSSSKQDHLLWSHQPLQVGDEMIIRIIEDAECAVPSEVYQLGMSPDQEELRWLKKTAKRRGYKLVRSKSLSR